MLTADNVSEIFYQITNKKAQHIVMLGGMTNSNFLITTSNVDGPDNQYVLRIPGLNSNNMINRLWEIKNQILASDFGLNVPTVYFNENNGIKITKFLKGAETLKPNTIKEHIKDIVKRLRELHTSNLKFQNEFNPFLELDKYLRLVKKENLNVFNDDLEKSIIFFKELEKHIYKINQSKYGSNLFLKPTHGDLVSENILYDNGKIYIIDWEYSGLNDPLWDIASLFLENNFTKKDEEYFLRLYSVDKQDRQKIGIFKNVQDILWSVWTLAKLDSQNKKEYLEYAKNRLERVLKYNI